MKCIICAIAKLENAYLYEWAKYHIDLGFSCIHIYDNNDVDGERVADVFEDGEMKNRIVIHDVRGQRYVQKKVYQECYEHEDFDWCAFIDIDEFITFSKSTFYDTITEFLAEINGWDAVHLNWRCYGDGGEVYFDYGKVTDRFKKAWRRDVCYTYLDKKENSHIKSIIRKGLKINWLGEAEGFSSNPHTPYGLSLICNSAGNPLPNTPFSEVDYSRAYIRHFITKSIEEYGIKVKRMCADTPNETYYNVSKFFRVNMPTIRKLYWISRNYPEVGIMDCIKEHMKFFSINHNLPTKYLFKSLRKLK